MSGPLVAARIRPFPRRDTPRRRPRSLPARSDVHAFADRLVRVYAPLLERVDALDWQTLTPAMRGALRAAAIRVEAFDLYRQHLVTTADVVASCREADTILTELTRILDAMRPVVAVVAAPCGCVVLDDEWCRTCGGCGHGDEWGGCCRCAAAADTDRTGGRS